MKQCIVLVDTQESFENLLPISYTRPVGDFRVGIQTIRTKWEAMLPGDYSYITVDYLQEKYPAPPSLSNDLLFIAGNVVPNRRLAAEVASLKVGDALADSDGFVAFRGSRQAFESFDFTSARSVELGVGRLHYVFDVFRLNGAAICEDYERIVGDRESQPLHESVQVIGPRVLPNGQPSVFIEEGASIEGVILNVKEGPIYIGKDAEVMEGSCLRGPLAICRNAHIRMGTRIYKDTTIGPWCKIGGEIDNSVLFSYSNKAHDGYLGNAVIGEWCNIGAGSTASNLKNDYSKIRIWNYRTRTFMRTNLQFCGLIMADHSKAGINTMFNTATVVGVGVNLHGTGFPRQFVPSFWAGSPEGGFTNVQLNKFFDLARIVMQRRGLDLTEVDRRIFDTIYNSAERFK